jgi:tetratricopeptide (TPR) repeat protein
VNGRWLVYNSVVLLLFAGIAISTPGFELGWLYLNLYLFYAGTFVSIAPHEFGHLVAAKLLGLRAFRMVIGSGRVLLSWKMFEVPTELRVWPVEGFVQAGFTTKNWFRLKKAIFAGAGPLVNVAIAVAIWFLGDYGKLHHFPRLNRELHPLLMLFAANVFLVASSLIPRKCVTQLGKLPSDGWHVLTAPFLKPSEISESLAGTWVLEADALIAQQRIDEAISVIEAGLARFPNCLGLVLQQGHIAMKQWDWERSRERFLSALGQLPKGDGLEVVLHNNIAYANALLARPELAEEADKYSASAFKAMSWVPAYRGTRGSVLVQFGQLEEGRNLLEASAAATEASESKAENLCWIALAAVRQGKVDEAEQFLDQARALAGDTLPLKWAQAAVHARQVESPWPAASFTVTDHSEESLEPLRTRRAIGKHRAHAFIVFAVVWSLPSLISALLFYDRLQRGASFGNLWGPLVFLAIHVLSIVGAVYCCLTKNKRDLAAV